MRSSFLTEIRKACRHQPQLTFRMLSYVSLGLAASLLTPWPLKMVIDDVLQGPSRLSLPVALVSLSSLYFGLIFLRGYFNHQRHQRLTEWSDEATEALRLRVFERSLQLKLSAAQNVSAEDLRLRFGEDIDRIRDSWVEVFSTAFAETLMLLGAFAVLFTVDWQFAALSFLGLGLLAFIYSFFPRRIAEKNSNVRETESRRALQLGKAVVDRMLVKTWGQEKREAKKLKVASSVFAQKNLDKANWEGRFIFSVEGVTGMVQALTLGYGAFRVSGGTLSIGDLVLFLQYLMLMHAPIGRLSAFMVVFHRGVASWKRVDEVLHLETERPGFSSPQLEDQVSLEFHKVSFSYRSGSALFDNVSFHARPGEVVAITGPSGVGKSTLLKMILGFYEPLSGAIRLNGKSLASLDLESIRRQIAYVDQESGVFSASLRENLTYGQIDVSEKSLHQVCQALRISEFVQSWPEAYETFLDERGANLSVGQRQRIVLARALLSDRRLILMDEPTSALDSALEEDLLKALPALLVSRTVILVTHRAAPLRLADQIIHLDRPGLRSHSPVLEMHP